jgi:PII-like signaling protein
VDEGPLIVFYNAILMASILNILYGANTRQIHTFRFDTLSEDMPLIVEIVDVADKLEKFLETIEPHIKAGLVTIEKAQVKVYKFESK